MIFLGSVLYSLSTIMFIFPHKLLLGGTSGIAIILNRFFSLSPGTFSMILNFSLIVISFFVLGKDMTIKTFFGSFFTTVFIGLFERVFVFEIPIVSNIYLSSLCGAAIIAIASGIMFYVDSSSGGTDIIALIVKKFSRINIGKALLITDVLIVIVGGIISGLGLFISSFLGLLIKTLGIDFIIMIIKKSLSHKKSIDKGSR